MVVAFEIVRPWPRRSSIPGCPRYWPALVTVWHVEPGGRDAGEVCKHHTRYRDLDGTWKFKARNYWRFHVHHFRLQLHPVQKWRRRLLTRCEWCGGRSRKGDPVNLSHGGRESGPWWRGETGLFHVDCASIATAHLTCVCTETDLSDWSHGVSVELPRDLAVELRGTCGRCGKRRGYGLSEGKLQRLRLLAVVPRGRRDKQVYELVCSMAKAER